MFGVLHNLIVVVEADKELSLEFLPLKADKVGLLLTPKPAVYRIINVLRLETYYLLHNLPRLLLDLLTQVGFLSNNFSSMSRTTNG